MHDFPPLPPVADAPPALFDGGHLWLLELVDGGPLRFQLRESGRLRFGDADRVLGEGVEALPPRYRCAGRQVRDALDRAALRAAVDDVSAVTVCGVSTHRGAVAYDWARTPPFVGYDVHDGTRDRFLSPDVVERSLDRLGLAPANAVAKERRAADFDAEGYAMPDSAYYDGPAAGVVVRSKAGPRARIDGPVGPTWAAGASAERAGPPDVDVAELADRYLDRDRFERAAAALEAAGRPVTFEAVAERVRDGVAREHHAVLPGEDGGPAFREAVAARINRFLADR
ncbi:MAG: hypothetical protein ABEJ70_03285 [Halobacteriaceae archaeon]